MELTRLNKATFHKLNLSNSKIIGNVDAGGVEVFGDVYADLIDVGGSFSMKSAAVRSSGNTREGMIINRAIIRGNVQMEGATFEVNLNADAIEIGASPFLNAGKEVAKFENGIL